jgi:hypothetical protein
LSLPEVQYNPASASREVDITGSFSKEILPKFALRIQDTYINLNPKGGPAEDGFSPLTFNAKYQFGETWYFASQWQYKPHIDQGMLSDSPRANLS